MKPKKWTYQLSRHDASLYETRTQWAKSSPGGFHWAKRNGFLDKFCLHMRNGRIKWTKEACAKEAIKYKTRTEWARSSEISYCASLKSKWMDDLCSHMSNGRIKWTKEACLQDALKYKGRKEWKIKSSGAVSSAINNGWYKECSRFMEDQRTANVIWTRVAVLADARKYNKQQHWRENSYGAYDAALNKGWLKAACAHMQFGKRKWTKQACLADAKKYSSRSEWMRASPAAFSAAHKANWDKEASAHMERMQHPEGYWNKFKNCFDDAQRFASRLKWRRHSGLAAKSALAHGWYETCCKHMKRATTGSPRAIYTILDISRNYAYVGLTDNLQRRFTEHLADRPLFQDSPLKGPSFF